MVENLLWKKTGLGHQKSGIFEKILNSDVFESDEPESASAEVVERGDIGFELNDLQNF